MNTKLQEKLARGEVVLGLGLSYPAPGIVERIGKDWDWLWIDGQHGQIDYERMIHVVRTAETCGIDVIPRVPGHDYSLIGPVMDMSLAGIMLPMVNSAEEARKIVEAVYSPPLGQRSFGGRRILDRIGRSYKETSNDDILLVIQIETARGVENAEAIAATEGVDVLFVGFEDLRINYGLGVNHPIEQSDELLGAIEKVSKAAKNAGKMLGTIWINPALMEMVLSLGYQLIVAAADMILLTAASTARRNEAQDIVASYEVSRKKG